MRVIIAGSRDIKDRKLVIEAIQEAPFNLSGAEIISGGAEGVDTIAREYAEEMDLEYKEFRPDWDEYGKSAGPQRNEAMCYYANTLIAVWDGQSPGTRDVIEKALSHGLDIYVKQNRSNEKLAGNSIRDW